MSSHAILPGPSAKRRRGNDSTERTTKRRGIAAKKQDVNHLKRDDIPEDAVQFKVCCSFILSFSTLIHLVFR
jgi:hypothetical protein